MSIAEVYSSGRRLEAAIVRRRLPVTMELERVSDADHKFVVPQDMIEVDRVLHFAAWLDCHWSFAVRCSLFAFQPQGGRQGHDRAPVNKRSGTLNKDH